MDHLSLPFSFDQINELLDFCPSDDHYHFQQNNLFHEKKNDQPAIQGSVGPITHNKQPNVGNRLKSSSSSANASLGNLEDVCKTKKLLHRDVERQRRQEMATLYRTLRSELPIECLKGKRSAADHIHETVGYIRQMHKRIEKLNENKEKLMLIKNQGSSSSTSTTSSKRSSKPSCNKQTIPSVQVKSSMSSEGIEIFISTDGVVNLSGVLNIVCGEGLSLLNCVSARVDSIMLHTLLIQLNVDGSSSLVESISGTGYIVRNGQGYLVKAGCRGYAKQSALLAELKSLVDGLILCGQNGLYHLEVETDSKKSVELLNSKKGPWHLRDLTETACRLLKSLNGKISHVFREQNVAADFLASYGREHGGVHEFNGSNAPSMLKAIATLEQCSVTYIR